MVRSASETPTVPVEGEVYILAEVRREELIKRGCHDLLNVIDLLRAREEVTKDGRYHVPPQVLDLQLARAECPRPNANSHRGDTFLERVFALPEFKAFLRGQFSVVCARRGDEWRRDGTDEPQSRSSSTPREEPGQRRFCYEYAHPYQVLWGPPYVASGQEPVVGHMEEYHLIVHPGEKALLFVAITTSPRALTDALPGEASECCALCKRIIRREEFKTTPCIFHPGLPLMKLDNLSDCESCSSSESGESDEGEDPYHYWCCDQTRDESHGCVVERTHLSEEEVRRKTPKGSQFQIWRYGWDQPKRDEADAKVAAYLDELWQSAQFSKM